MRKSKKATRPRWVRVGLTTGVVGAALLVAPQAAYAGVGTVTPAIVAPGGTAKLTEAALTGTPVIQISTAASCPSPSVAAGANNTSPWVATNSGALSGTTQAFTLPAAVTPNANGVVKSYIVCAYNAGTVGSTLLSSGTINVGVVPVLGPTIGPTGGGNQINITGGPNGAIFTGVASPAGFFSTSACPATYGTTPANAVNVNKLSDNTGTVPVPGTVTSTGATATSYNVCLYNGNASGSTLLSANSYLAAAAVPSSMTGPSGSNTGPSITFQAPQPIFTGLNSIGVSFTTNANCTAYYNSTSTAGVSTINVTGTTRKLANNKVAVTVPNLATNNATYQACIYAGVTGNGSSGDELLATAPYNTVTVQSINGVTPAAGPSLGGNTITVSGAAFPTTPGSITATLGGSPLVVTPRSANGFTAVVPPHAAAKNATLVVTTDKGTATYNNAYSFIGALQLETNTAPNTLASVDIVVNGIGFQTANWNTGSLTGAHIYLVDGVYDPSPNGSAARSNAPIQECANVLAITDTQLVCSLQLNRRFNAAGDALYVPSTAPTRITATTVNGSRYLTATSTPFDVMMEGMMVGGATIPPNTRIAKVIDSGKVLLSNPANANVSGDTNVVVVPATAMRTVTVGIAAGGAVAGTNDLVTNTNGVLTSADLSGNGVYLWGPDLGGTAVPATKQLTDTTHLSTNVGTGGSGNLAVPAEQVQVYTPVPYTPVPEGAYSMTFVSNGTVNAPFTDPDYDQSAISSGSTFTVASF